MRWTRCGGVLVAACLACLAGLGQPLGTAGQETVSGANVVEPAFAEAPSKNAGVFVGINTFKDKNFENLDYAVNDALAMAYLSVVELKLIPAANCQLLLAGEPTLDRKEHLKKLADLGAKIENTATKSDILAALEELQGLGGDLVLMSLSSHGIVDNGIAYVIPSDCRNGSLGETALKLPSLDAKLEETKSKNRLVFCDACQQRIPVKATGAQGAGGQMTEEFASALKNSRGHVRMASCEPGEFSREDRQSQQGVFTDAVLRALRGEATPRAKDNIVDLAAVMASVHATLQKLPADRKQTATLYGASEQSRAMPLAVRASDTKQLLANLKKKVTAKGFTSELCDQLAAVLPRLNRTQVADQEFLEEVRSFAAGRLKERLFVLSLNERFSRSTTLVPPKAAAPRPTDLMPTVTSTAAAMSPGTKAGDVWEGNSLQMRFRWCPKGKFKMGSPKGEPDRQSDEDQVSVTLAKGFWMGESEVTQGEWERIMKTTLAQQRDKANKGYSLKGEGERFPMYFVSDDEATAFAKKLTETDRKVGKLPARWEYRLPTEAQWEYACRAGTTTATAFGDTLASTQANFNGDYPYNGADKGPALRQTRPVGRLAANDWGLQDMHGNVCEWCRDWYAARLDGGDDPQGPAEASVRVYRGGGWYSHGGECRSAHRHKYVVQGYRNSYLGFRVAAVQAEP